MQAMNGSAVTFRARGRLIGCCVVLVLGLSALLFAPVAGAATPPPTTTYLALGDSISFGYTQEKFEENFPNEAPSYFENGVANYFAADLRKANKGVTIVNDACPGETSNGLIGENPALGGQATPEGAEEKSEADYFPCSYHNTSGLPLHNSLKALSQLEDATQVLGSTNGATGEKPAHPILAITLNLGNNDELNAIAKCETRKYREENGYPVANLTKGEEESTEQYEGRVRVEEIKGVKACIGGVGPTHTIPHVLKNTEDILNVLTSKYSGRIVVLGFYNPDTFILSKSDELQQYFNGQMKLVVEKYSNARFANPFPVFNKGATESAAEQKSICKYTEMCNPRQEAVQKSKGKFGGDIHPSLLGYKALGKLVNEAYLAP